jgi:hypothetical protein
MDGCGLFEQLRDGSVPVLARLTLPGGQRVGLLRLTRRLRREMSSRLLMEALACIDGSYSGPLRWEFGTYSAWSC